jgi:hypothetical protein
METIELVHSDKGAPNFMLALVLCAYTEFWLALSCSFVFNLSILACLSASDAHSWSLRDAVILIYQTPELSCK